LKLIEEESIHRTHQKWGKELGREKLIKRSFKSILMTACDYKRRNIQTLANTEKIAT